MFCSFTLTVPHQFRYLVWGKEPGSLKHRHCRLLTQKRIFSTKLEQVVRHRNAILFQLVYSPSIYRSAHCQLNDAVVRCPCSFTLTVPNQFRYPVWGKEFCSSIPACVIVSSMFFVMGNRKFLHSTSYFLF
jgi:hypothetical protein